jgi:hypothetical protein
MPKSWADRLPAARRSHEIVNMAAQRADELADEGDADGAGAWRRIIEAIDELQHGRRKGKSPTGSATPAPVRRASRKR